ncbi:hypothetical protein [Streptomyces solicathayae]|uniref:Uncharacterized protein n=1 Tax=Streptomyces solicathayae TaxID=3081768 RepID=A0ABZ0M031_9ACTN|nr:hypothetical protein [Streptomyces sp. HUAS YS2]WOX24992.1 hypothetical protein R2D22_27840 [Streptomyces sp. HUAS YS2]
MANGSEVVHGFPHLDTVHRAITALYRRLSADGVLTYTASVAPADIALGDDEDLHLGAQRVARTLVRHLRLPEARMVVSFREMEHAAAVELEAGPEYFVELNDRFRRHRRDIGAALAHEITHVLLHRLDLGFPGHRDNELLTDTVTTYLGAGWLLLDAFREDGMSSQKLGYLTPEEFGYVLALRALVFDEDPSPWFTSPQAYEAYGRGRERALREARRPPLAGAGWARRHRYVKERRLGRAGPDAPYAFEGAGGSLRVSFPCPTCHQRIRVPATGRRIRARCGLCGTVLDCEP